MQPAVLVHLSDIHFHTGDRGQAARMNAVRTELMRDLAAMRIEIGDATAVVVTGDIAFSGERDQYTVAREWLDGVAETVGSSDALVLTVPGNHDVHWGSIEVSAEIARQSLRTCPESAITHLIDRLIDDPTRPLLAPLDNYNEFALGYRCEVPESGLPWQAPLPLPRGYHLALRGLTTVFNSDGDDTSGSLVVGRTQTSLPLEDPGAVHVLIAHHGPEDCRETTEFRDRIRHKVWALLSGHRHDQRIRMVDGCLEITAGAVHPEEQPGYYPTYNWIRFDVVDNGADGNSLVIDVWQRVLRPENNRFSGGNEDGRARREVIQLPAIPPSVAQPASSAQQPSAADSSESETVERDAEGDPEGAAARPPLVNEEGRVDEQRRIARDLLDLPITVQERVLFACGLIAEEDLALNYTSMVLTGLGRASSDDALARLADAIKKAKPTDETEQTL